VGGAKVLIVEDQKPQRNIMKRWLQHEGFECIEAEDGIGALEEFERYNGDIKLVVLDILMPRMDGITLLEEIRSRSISGAPMVIATAIKSDRMKNLDVFAIFNKPLDHDAFIGKVQKAFYFGARMKSIRERISRLHTAIGTFHTMAAAV